MFSFRLYCFFLPNCFLFIINFFLFLIVIRIKTVFIFNTTTFVSIQEPVYFNYYLFINIFYHSMEIKGFENPLSSSTRKRGFKSWLQKLQNFWFFILFSHALLILIFCIIFKANNCSSGNKGVFTITINTVYFHCIYCKCELKLDAYIQILAKILAKECSEYTFNQGLRDTLKCATDFSACY